MVRGAWALLFTLAVARGGLAAESKGEQLARKATEVAGPADAEWKRYVLEPETIDENALKALLALCEKAVDLYQDSLEEEESSAVNNAIITLARRIARIRFDLLRRERAREKPPEPNAPKKPEIAPPAPAPPETPTKPPAPPENPTATEIAPVPAAPPLPEIVEDEKATRMGTQALRNFLMNDYFAARKWASLVVRCPLCEGSGRRPTGRQTKNHKVETTVCTSCGETGFHLNDPVARKGFWLCKSPLYRADPERVQGWEAEFEGWRKDPRTVAEFLERLSIEKIEYHGLWAKVILAEKGHVLERTAEGKPPAQRKFNRKREYTLIRIGRRWFFYDETIDQGLFREE